MEVIVPDGDLISEDGWREDTLIYYVLRSDWRHAIGMKVLCDYFPDAPHPVTIHFWEESLKHLESLSDSHLALMLQRLAQTLYDHPEYRWKTLTFEFPDWLVARVDENAILAAFEGAGWLFHSRDTHLYKWKRHPPGGAA
jgi:hypothetical protein